MSPSRWLFPAALVLLSSCSSTREAARPRPPKIESCQEVASRVSARDVFYGSLRGSATLVARGRSVDLETALVSGERLKDIPELVGSGLARIELVGPLGIRLGLIVLNPRWLYVFLVHEKTLYRFPADELRKDTLRREALFAKLPVRLSPELFFLTFLARAGVEPGQVPECDFDDDSVAYRLRIPEKSGGKGGRVVWVEPHEFYPLKALRFDGELPSLRKAEESRAASVTTYDKVLGAGPATLPSRISVRLNPGGEPLEYTWRKAEAWPNLDMAVFEWEPPAGMRIIDL